MVELECHHGEVKNGKLLTEETQVVDGQGPACKRGPLEIQSFFNVSFVSFSCKLYVNPFSNMISITIRHVSKGV